MTGWVFITAGGGRWHLDGDCRWLARGQQDASERGLSTHPIQRVSMAGVGDRLPCRHCAEEYADQLVADSRLLPKDDDRQTQSEVLFRDRVLTMPELATWKISAQVDVTVAGRTYRPDFVLTHADARIAIEIDGLDKGPEAPTHDQWTRRQNALSRAGYEVLRFTNRQVREDPEACRRDVLSSIVRLEERTRLAAVGAPRRPAAKAAPTPRVKKVTSAAPPTSPVPPPPLAPPPPVVAPAPPPGQRKQDSAHRFVVITLVVAVALVALTGLIVVLKGSSNPGVAPHDDGTGSGFLVCPDDHPLKGNISRSGEKIVHSPGGAFYDKTNPERCFASLDEAAKAGFRPAH